MRSYTASFTGRQKGAIGVFYHINVDILADSFNEAVEKLYQQYEHIKDLKLEVKP